MKIVKVLRIVSKYKNGRSERRQKQAHELWHIGIGHKLKSTRRA